MFDLMLTDGTIMGECCHGSSRMRAELEEMGIDFKDAQPYKMGKFDVCDGCGWGPGNADALGEYDMSEFVSDYSEIYA